MSPGSSDGKWENRRARRCVGYIPSSKRKCNEKICPITCSTNFFLHPKENVTKKFVEQVMGQTNGVDEVLANMPEDVDGQLAQLHFVGEKTNQTLISTISKKFPADDNILQGNMTQTQRGAYGTLIGQLVGEKKVIEQVIAYVKEAPAVEIEVIADVL